MADSEILQFEELECQEEMSAWWQYALAIGGGVAAGVIVYVGVAAAT